MLQWVLVVSIKLVHVWILLLLAYIDRLWIKLMLEHILLLLGYYLLLLELKLVVINSLAWIRGWLKDTHRVVCYRRSHHLLRCTLNWSACKCWISHVLSVWLWGSEGCRW